MYKIVNDICDLCSKEHWEQAEGTLRVDNPRWFGKSGLVYAKYFNAYLSKRKREYTKLNPGPCFCCDIPCSACGNSTKICLNHLRNIVHEVENFDT